MCSVSSSNGNIKGNKRKQRVPKRRTRNKTRISSTKKGKGISNRGIPLKHAITQIRKSIHHHQPKTVAGAIQVALKTANKIRKNIRPSRIINVPKTGGILPLIPIFAGLSALGALSGGAAGIAKAVNDAKAAKQQLDESQRHNKTMEAIAVGKGVFMKPYKTGLGLFLGPAQILKNYP